VSLDARPGARPAGGFGDDLSVIGGSHSRGNFRGGAPQRRGRHEDDNRIYECAAAAKANYIVTENAKHFKQPHTYTQIITARQLLRLLEAGEA